MSQVNLNPIVENLDSKQIERQIPAIEDATRLLKL